jgi:anti-sigma regulatory factor (Ser/Thr protein kinase)/predicted transcriptional regulator
MQTMRAIPINTYDSPTVILELIYKLKVRNVMCTTIHTAERLTPLRDIQRTMKEKGITGMPIAEEGTLYGIVSMDDIIQALEGGYIMEPAEQHMSRKLTVLEEDMPISFAISYFEKYPYHRFPVLDKNRSLSGIVTSRDITTRLLVEINKEMEKIERISASPAETGKRNISLEFKVIRNDFENAGHASTEIKKLLKHRNCSSAIIRRAAIAAYELEMNLVVHSDGGTISIDTDEDSIVIKAQDIGPGIPNVEQALQEGYSTADEWIRSLGFGAGMGLPNCRRVADTFSIESSTEGLNRGTSVQAVINDPP